MRLCLQTSVLNWWKSQSALWHRSGILVVGQKVLTQNYIRLLFVNYKLPIFKVKDTKFWDRSVMQSLAKALDSDPFIKFITELESANRYYISSYITIFALVLSIFNLLGSNFNRAFIFLLLGLLGLLQLACSKTKWASGLQSTYVIVAFLCFYIVICFANGGLDNPKVLLVMGALFIWELLFFGISRLKIISAINSFVALILVLLEVSGLLPKWQWENDFPPLIGLILYIVPLAMIFIGISLLTRNLKKSINFLALEYSSAANMARRESSFLSRISHEIRNPLNGMLGLIEAAKHEATSPEMRENLWLAEKTGDQLLSVLNEVLEFKKLQSQDFALDPKPLNTAKMAKTISSVFKNLALEKHITLQSKSDYTKLPHIVMADTKRVTQVMTNLLSNAIKFTPIYGNITIESQYDHAAGMWSIEIQDTGPGMSAATVDKLFKPFSQGDISEEMSSQGAGLGLMISRQLANQMGGDLTVRSALGQGSTFRFTFLAPVVQESDKAEAELKSPSSSPSVRADKIDLSNRHILCVDDSEANVRVMTRALENAGATVYATVDPQIALMIAFDTDIDLVLTDISMPEMSGEELLLEIRKTKPDLPILAITGHVLEEDRAHFIQAGFKEIVTKPVSSSRLCEIVEFNLTH